MFAGVSRACPWGLYRKAFDTFKGCCCNIVGGTSCWWQGKYSQPTQRNYLLVCSLDLENNNYSGIQKFRSSQ
jgi:hypothetical protein